MSKLIIGCGYLGDRVLRLWCQTQEQIHVLSRRPGHGEEFSPRIQPIVADVCDPRSLTNLPAVDTVLFAVGFDGRSEHSIHEVYAQGLANVLAALPEDTGRVIYISTTGVYGPAGGEWVDENTPANPQRDGGKASLAAEQVLAAHPIGKRSIILRLAGIYGPNRIPQLNKLATDEPLALPTEGWLNLIHVDDAAAIVVAIDNWATANPITDGPEVFCVSDGHPVVRGDYYREASRLAFGEEPTFVEPDPNSPAAQRARSDKRISNGKLLDTLGYQFLYPDYRTGLAAVLAK